MSTEKILLLCYNRGCGNKFDPNNNKEDACAYHPGHPVFHDAYKGWSCCKKKCTDFTEFLNIKGCTKSRHSNEKPPEPVKPEINKSKVDEVIEYQAPVSDSPMKRPPFNTPQVTIIPKISPDLLATIENLVISKSVLDNETKIKIGQSCTNKACKASYQGPESNEEVCNYHSGVAIFHEGLKYWSCCQKKTTDFSVFLEQPGCTEGTHSWFATNVQKKVQCRMDWHQTGTQLVVSFYAKKYQPDKSSIKLNPIRLTVNFFFPEDNSYYSADLALQGIIEVNKSSVNMCANKIEINLKKAEPIWWTKLDIPITLTDESETLKTSDDGAKEDSIANRVDAVDLNDL